MNESTSFHDRLLAVLETEIARRTAQPHAAANPRRVWGRRMGALAGAGVLAVAVALGAPMLLGGQQAGAEAWAVQARADGSVQVQIRELRDPAGLERRLAEAGISAYVDFMPFGMVCAPRTMLPNDEHAKDYGLESAERGFIVHPGRLPADKRVVLVGYADANGEQIATFFTIAPRDEERCIPHPMATPSP